MAGARAGLRLRVSCSPRLKLETFYATLVGAARAHMQYAPTAHVQPHEPFARQHATMPSGKQLWLHMQRPPLLLPVFPALPPVPARGVVVLPVRPPPSAALEPPAAVALVEPVAAPAAP